MAGVEDFDPLDYIYAASGLKRPEKSIVESIPVPQYRQRNAQKTSLYDDLEIDDDEEEEDEFLKLNSRQLAMQTAKDIREVMTGYEYMKPKKRLVDSEDDEVTTLSSASDNDSANSKVTFEATTPIDVDKDCDSQSSSRSVEEILEKTIRDLKQLEEEEKAAKEAASQYDEVAGEKMDEEREEGEISREDGEISTEDEEIEMEIDKKMKYEEVNIKRKNEEVDINKKNELDNEIIYVEEATEKGNNELIDLTEETNKKIEETVNIKSDQVEELKTENNKPLPLYDIIKNAQKPKRKASSAFE